MSLTRSNRLRPSDKIAVLGQEARRFPERLAGRAREFASIRLGVDYIDLHFLNWRGTVPLVETLEGFEEFSPVAHRNGKRTSVVGNLHHRNAFQVVR